MAILYILSGTVLVLIFAFVLVYYFSPKRKDRVEAAKYEMLNDYDEPIADDEPEIDSPKE
ncbi:MAG: CcoQ/FixQ family Cbb3-type cytochrome c oxidase assembly chaperone [Desulfocapsa sp.]|nr:MAG: CcoQ/FixQ family Cbb3-type cytochrome c oxidase assembly chaperone [Desulfocapsa sp.]